MRIKLFLLCILLLNCCITLHAQQQQLDSLFYGLKNHPQQDSVRLILFCRIGKYYFDNDRSKLFQYEDSAYILASKLHDLYWMANACNGIGGSYVFKGDYSLALTWFEKALDLSEQSGSERRISQSKTNIAAVKNVLGDFNDALTYLQNALSNAIASKQKDEIASCLGNISGLYGEQHNYPKSLEYGIKALQMEEELNDKPEIVHDLIAIGIVYVYLLDSTKALSYMGKALSLNKEVGDQTFYENLYTNIGNVYSDIENNYQKAIEFQLRALAIARMRNTEELSICYSNLAVDYMDLSDFDKAFKYADSAQKVSDELAAGLDYNALGEILAYAPDSTLLKNGINPKTKDSLGISYLTSALKIAKQAGDLAVQRDAYNNLSTIYANMKNYSLSLDAYKNYITLRDSIINNAKRQQLISIEMQYDFDKKTDSLKFQQQITNSKLQQQIELEKSNLALSNKEKDLQKLAYLKTQSDLQNTELKESQKSKQLTIAQREQQLQQAKVKTLVQAASLNKLQLQQQWLYSIGALILIALTASWIIYNNRLRQHRLKTELAKEKAEQEKKEAEFQRNLADVSLTALRSQMNPHFIFNCLNSIKLYTAQNDTAAASEYLTKFSKLIRLVMENSRNDKIPLASELNALQLYIEMEAMRFKQKLKYNIHVDENAETDYIEIPPLLLQPYVENAIWHGLMHKEEGGKIDVGVSMTKDNSLLQITISDNGIGRAKSAELRSKTATKHKSYGMKVTSERIALINQIYKTGADVKVNDLFDEAGNAAGTKVTIQIPV